LAFNSDQHHLNSSLRENIVEHSLIAGILRELWTRGITDCEILRSEFDAYGYDLVLSYGDLVRHIQLKSSKGPKAKDVGIAQNLANKPSGCVLLICVDDELNLGPFYWYGGNPGEPLPIMDDLPTLRRTTPNKDGVKPVRSNHRRLPAKRFSYLSDIEDVVDRLLGFQD
jgi:hypothetical protein